MSGPVRVLLTGAGGMVGKNILEHPDARHIDWVAPPRRELDLLDPEAVHKCLIEVKPDLIIHAAGRVGGIQANIAEPVRFLTENLQMGINLAHGAREAGIKRLINLGSSCMYPRDSDKPLREEQILSSPLEPTNEGYAIAKIAVAKLCEYIGREDSSYHYKTLIPCNLYGRYDQFSPQRSHLIPAIIHKLHEAKTRGADSVEIWGDGLARREFMYAGDLADAVLRAVTYFASLPAVMNVGTGDDYTVNEYYQAAAQVVGYKGRFTHDLSKPVGMKRKLVDIAQQRSWGWRAKTGLDEGLEQTYKFYLRERSR